MASMRNGFAARRNHAGAIFRRGSATGFGRIPPEKTKAQWGSEWKKASLKWHDKSAQIAFEGGHFPYRHNYMDRDPTYTERIWRSADPSDAGLDGSRESPGKHADQVSTELARRIGAKVGAARNPGTPYSVTFYQTTHVQGGTIISASPDQSVVNPWLQHWKTGGPTFPQSASGNPTLTIRAYLSLCSDRRVHPVWTEATNTSCSGSTKIRR